MTAALEQISESLSQLSQGQKQAKEVPRDPPPKISPDQAKVQELCKGNLVAISIN